MFMERLFSRLFADAEDEIKWAEARKRGHQQDSGGGCGDVVPLMSERKVDGDACEGDAGKHADDDLYIGDIPFHISKILFYQSYLV
jgi:hypothetical protein